MLDYMTLGPTPADEPCAQVGSADYYERAREECARYKAQLLRQFGEPPKNASLRVKGFPHDFGTYYEVCVVYEANDETACEYAYRLEAHLPAKWDAVAAHAGTLSW